MTLAELRERLEQQAPGSLVPVSWVLSLVVELEPAATRASADGADLTAAEAGDLLGRSASTVREYARAGRLPGSYRQRGREWRVPRSAIEAFRQAEATTMYAEPEPSEPESTDLGSWRRAYDADAA